MMVRHCEVAFNPTYKTDRVSTPLDPTRLFAKEKPVGLQALVSLEVMVRHCEAAFNPTCKTYNGELAVNVIARSMRTE